MASGLGVTGDVGYTCETAAFFQLEHIQSRIEKFRIDTTTAMTAMTTGTTATTNTPPSVSDYFPFTSYFADAPQPLFSGTYVSYCLHSFIHPTTTPLFKITPFHHLVPFTIL